MRIVTYNTRGSLGMDGIRSTSRIVQAVRALSPDIVCFQEIHDRLRWSGGENQPAALAAGLNRRFEFQANLRFGFGSYGIGIAHRGTVILRREHILPQGKEHRGALEVQLRGIEGMSRLTVICTHWGLTQEERVEQAEAMANIVIAVRGPVILGGDLNEAADRPAVCRLLQLTGLIDLGADQNQATFVSDNPTNRIDYLFASPDLGSDCVEVVSCLASDHLPVMADVGVLTH